MMEATRLTREGRLMEAMAVLRGANPPDRSPASSGPDGDEAQEPWRNTPSILGMTTPAAGALDLPRSDKPQSPINSRNATPPRPGVIGGLLGRMKNLGLARGLTGLIGPAVGRVPIFLPAGARFEERMYANAAGSRAYKLYVPSGYSGQPLPLVVMLHGCTQSPDDFAAGTRMNDVAEEQTFLVAYPAQSQSANASKCWNWFNSADQQRDRGEPSLIAGITRKIMQDFPVEAGRVYIAGLSAGGAAAAVMGATHPDLYAAIGVHSGLACGAASDIPSAFAAMKQGAPASVIGSRPGDASVSAVPTIVFHGDRDTTVNMINGDQVIAQSHAAADLRITTDQGKAVGGMDYTRIVHADESGRPMVEQWVLHGAGHAWSGGSSAGSYTDPRGPDASREMIRFFLRHATAEASIRQTPAKAAPHWRNADTIAGEVTARP